MDWEAYEEAERRGLLTPGQTEALAEARRRGLAGAPQQPSRAEAFGRGALNWSTLTDNIYQGALEQVGKLDPDYMRQIASRKLGPQAATMTPKQIAQAQTDKALRAPEERAFQAHPLSSIGGSLVGGGLVGGVAGLGAKAPLAAEFGLANRGLPLVERMATNAVRAAPAGGITGAVTGAGSAEGPNDNRALSGAVGALIGAPAGAALGAALPEVIGGVASAAKFGQGVANRFNLTPEQRALRMIQRRVDPAALRGTDGPEQIVDVGGKRLVGLGDAIAQLDETPGAEIMSAARTGQKQDVQDFMLARGAGATGKDQGGYHGAIDDLKAKRKADAAPLYDQANQTPVGWEGLGRLGAVLQRVPRGLLAEADNLAAIEGNPAPTPFQRLDYVSRAIGAAADRESPMDLSGRRQSSELGRALYGLKAELDDGLMTLSDEQSGGALRAARAAYKGPSAQMEAQRLGRSIVTARNFDPEDLAVRVGKMSADEQDSMLLGLARGLADQSESGQVARFANNLRNNRRLQQRLIMAMGEERFATLLEITSRSSKMLENTNRMLGNSATAGRQQNIRNATDGEAEGAQMALDVLTGNARNVLARKAGQWWLRSSMPGARDPRVSEALARRLTQRATPENVRALVDDMAGLNQYRGAALSPAAVPVPALTYGAVGGGQPNRPRGLFGGGRK